MTGQDLRSKMVGEGQQAKLVSHDPLTPQALQNEARERLERLDAEIAELEDRLNMRRHARMAVSAAMDQLMGPQAEQPRGY